MSFFFSIINPKWIENLQVNLSKMELSALILWRSNCSSEHTEEKISKASEDGVLLTVSEHSSSLTGFYYQSLNVSKSWNVSCTPGSEHAASSSAAQSCVNTATTGVLLAT